MNSSKFLITVFVYSIVFVFLFHPVNVRGMSSDAKNKTRLKVLEMFRHAYDAYMKNAFPADELMPLSCKGRYRGSEPSRGDVDDSLGNFTLSLIDSLDTLVVLGEIEEFEHAVKQVIENTKFDTDVIVSVFETNIRVVGGLLGGHVMAVYLRRKKLAMEWYKGELLNMAKDIGTRLLPAFNTTTGIPYPRINLKKGIDGFIQQNYKDTCTACAGTMVLEFAALSRFTGDPIFEEKAHKAMDFLWNQRHRSSDLVGTVINIHNGDWIRRDSGVGAGIDSYYEYVLKAYILLGDDSYLTRFNRHYEAVMKYVSQGPLFMDVHMHRPLTASKNFMDALLAFWPGLQVLKGDIPPAIEMHEMLYQVMQKHNFLPEAFTTDFHVHWGHHPLRPEFVESTYFLYRATGDPYYLEVGQKVVENLEKHARVKCGFAAIKDVTKGTQEDQMDSFVLAETFKYLYLLFADKSDLFFDMDDYIFTTEGHLLPLSLSRSNNSRTPAMRLSQEMYTHLRELEDASHIEDEYGDSLHNTCPNPKVLYKQSVNYAQSLRTSLNISPNLNRPPQRLDKQCTPTSGGMRSNRLKASQFVAGNKEHVQQLRDMGIQLATMADGRIQLLHTASEAINPQMAEEGFIFMQEMIDLSKHQPTDTQNEPMVIQILSSPFESEVFRAGPAQFGYDLKTRPPVRGQLEIAKPFKACSPIQNLYHVKGKIAIIERGDCMFIDKARVLQKAGAVAGICIDHTEGSSVDSQPLFAMSGDGTNDVSIPLVFLFKKEGDKLLHFIDKDPSLTVRIAARIEVVGPEVEPSGPGQYWEKQPEKSVVNQGSKNNKVFKSVIPLTSVSEEGKYEIDDTERKLGQIINFRKLEDGSQQMFFEFDKIEKYKSGSLPDMSSIYDSVVKILLEKTNFSKLDKQSEYLTAIAKLLESAHSGTNQADSSVQDKIQEMVRELEVLTEEELQEESLQEEVDNFEGTESLQTDGKTQVYNMEGVTITVKQSSSSSKRMSLSRNQADKVNDHKPYTDLSDTEVIQGPQDSEISDFSEEEISSESLYESVWSKTSDHFVDEHDLEQDADFRQLQAINSDLAQKLKNGIVEKRNKPIEQPQVTVKIVRKDISGNHVRKNIETIMVPEDDDEVHLREPDRSGLNDHTDEFRKSSKFSSQTSDGGDSETVTRTQKASVDSKGNDDNL